MRRRILASLGHKLTAKDYVQDGLVGLWDVAEQGGDSATLHNLASGGMLDIRFSSRNQDGEVLNESWVNNYLSWSMSASEFTFETVNRKTTAEESAVRYYPFTLIAGGEGNYISWKPYNGQARQNIGIRDGEAYTNVVVSWDDIAKSHTDTLLYVSGKGYAAYNGLKASASRTADLTTRTISSIRQNADRTSSSYSPSYLRCMRLYNRCLSDAEVAANFAVDKARFGLT